MIQRFESKSNSLISMIQQYLHYSSFWGNHVELFILFNFVYDFAHLELFPFVLRKRSPSFDLAQNKYTKVPFGQAYPRKRQNKFN